MKPTWIIVADSAIARIFAVSEAGALWEEKADLTHSESQLQAGELESDRPGRSYDSHGEGNHKMEPQHDRKTTEAIMFARQVSQFLARHEQEYEWLLLVCAPKFLGHLRDQLGKSVRRKVSEEIALNVVRESMDKIRSIVVMNSHMPVNRSRVGLNPGRTI